MARIESERQHQNQQQHSDTESSPAISMLASSLASSSPSMSQSSTMGAPITIAAAPGSRVAGAMAGAGSSSYEALTGFVCGAVFGAVSPLVGHPLDTIKTRMQVDPLFRGSTTTVQQTVTLIYQREGLRGFYRGFVPPLVGSMAFRAILFSAYSGTYAPAPKYPSWKNRCPLRVDYYDLVSSWEPWRRRWLTPPLKLPLSTSKFELW